jgi:ABC-2 type transport system permease protein
MKDMEPKKEGRTTFKKYFKIFLHLQKIGLMNRATYRVNFVILLFAVFLQMFFNLVFINVIFGFLDNIAGWTYHEALIIVATYMLIDGFLWIFTAHLASLVRHIKEGTLDGILVKPIDGQFLVSFWRGDIEDIVRISTGIFILVYALINLGATLGADLFLNIFLYLILLFNALIIGYSLSFFLKTVSFWVIEGRAFFHLSDTLFRISQYPTDIFYHSIVRILVSSIVPLAFMATVPAKILARGFDLWLIVGSFAVAGVFFVGSRKFFQFALKHYSSASS